MVPGARIELARSLAPRDFKSRMSTYSIIRAFTNAFCLADEFCVLVYESPFIFRMLECQDVRIFGNSNEQFVLNPVPIIPISSVK